MKKLIILWVFLLSGCATIFTGNQQVVTVAPSSMPKGIKCMANNGVQTWQLDGDNWTLLTRGSGHTMSIICYKGNKNLGNQVVSPSIKGMVWMNLLFFPGFIVDFASGSAFQYPSFVPVYVG